MSKYARLSSLDSSFLYLESPTAHMHVGAVIFLEDAGISEEDLTAHVNGRLHRVPRYRQKLAWVPGHQGRPVWVDDPSFDIRNHVIVTGVPAPGREREVLRLAGRLLGRPLDRTRPLWELWVVRMTDGRFALISKSHHCLVDGIGVVDIGTAIMDLTPDPPPIEAEPFHPEPAPSPAELLADALAERIAQPQELLRKWRASAEQVPGSLFERGLQIARGLLSQTNESMVFAPRVSFTRQIGPHRRFEVARMALSEVKAIKNRFHCTVNDVVLALVAGGVRHLLTSRNESVDGLTLRAMVPVSVRTDAERNAYGNRVSWVMTDLPVGIESPRERLRFVHDSMQHLKDSKQAAGTELLFQVGEYAPPTALALASKLAAFQRVCNLVVTNVPGPQFPLFFCGSRMLEAFPVVPIMGATSLGIAILSYDGQLNFGINADWDLFPDIEALARGIVASRDELSSAAGHAGDPVPVSPVLSR